MVRCLVELSGRPLSFTLLDISLYPGRWKTLLREVERANRDGLPIKGQVAGRPVALLYGLELSFHPFSTCPSYAAVADLPLAQKLAKLRDPPNYTPPAESRLDARAATLGVTPLELAYDVLVSGDGRTILFHPGAN